VHCSSPARDEASWNTAEAIQSPDSGSIKSHRCNEVKDEIMPH